MGYIRDVSEAISRWMTDGSLDRAWNEGMDAFENGIPSKELQEVCPYKTEEETFLRRAYLQGYIHAAETANKVAL